VGRIDRLVRLARADHRGRPPKPWVGFPAGAWLLAQAEGLALSASKPSPIVQGRHLIARGLTPGRGFGPILNACFEAQLDGAFDSLEGGLAYLTGVLAQPS
jgi:tRNA nucleotidyltransferase (CCA-adding enzyme)